MSTFVNLSHIFCDEIREIYKYELLGNYIHEGGKVYSFDFVYDQFIKRVPVNLLFHRFGTKVWVSRTEV